MIRMTKFRFPKVIVPTCVLFFLYLISTIYGSDFWGDILSPVCGAAASGILLYTYMNVDHTNSINITYLFLFFACLFWTTADILWAICAFLRLNPLFFIISNIAYFGTNVFFAVAVITFSLLQFKKWNGIQLIHDIVAIAASSILFVWISFFSKNPGNFRIIIGGGFISAASVLLDFVIITGIFIWLVSIRSDKIPIFNKIIDAGLLLFCFTDLIYYYLIFFKMYDPNSLIDGIYMASLMMVAFGAYLRMRSPSTGSKSVEHLSNIGVLRVRSVLFIFPIVTVISSFYTPNVLLLGDLFLFAPSL
jgi:hypothetical protein